MRSTLVISGILALAASSIFACSSNNSNNGDGSADQAATSDQAMATAALQNLGAKVPGAEGNCIQCHDINKATLKNWATHYTTTLAYVSDETKSADDRINYMRRDPSDPTSGFAPSKLGFLTAGAHLGLSGMVSQAKQPTAYKQGQIFAKLFAGRDADYAQFRNDTLMPIDTTYDRLDASQYEAVASWFAAGMPALDTLLVEAPRPTQCNEDFTSLTPYVRGARTENWLQTDKDNRLPMFACDASGDPTACFQQQFNGADIFPNSTSLDYASTWATGGATVRVLRALDYKTFYWMRSSASGQFVSNGGGPGTGGARAVIADLGAALNPAGPTTRDIAAEASYDPDFSPRDDWFMFQGTSRGGVMCSMSLLNNPATTLISFSEPQCSKLNSIGLYQTVGQVVGDNSIGDSFVVNSKFASDNPGLTASDADLDLTAGPDAIVKISVAIPNGNDANDGYAVKQSLEFPTPFQGDTMMARSGHLIGSRLAGDNGMLGYSINKVTYNKGSTGYSFVIKELGHICMPGNKANFSFDERFLVTHHYLTRADFSSDADWAPYDGKGASDIYLADMVTGTKTRITHMAPGQFALYPHFRADNWLYFLVRDGNTKKEYVSATDFAIRAETASP